MRKKTRAGLARGSSEDGTRPSSAQDVGPTRGASRSGIVLDVLMSADASDQIIPAADRRNLLGRRGELELYGQFNDALIARTTGDVLGSLVSCDSAAG